MLIQIHENNKHEYLGNKTLKSELMKWGGFQYAGTSLKKLEGAAMGGTFYITALLNQVSQTI